MVEIRRRIIEIQSYFLVPRPKYPFLRIFFLKGTIELKHLNAGKAIKVKPRQKQKKEKGK